MERWKRARGKFAMLKVSSSIDPKKHPQEQPTDWSKPWWSMEQIACELDEFDLGIRISLADGFQPNRWIMAISNPHSSRAQSLTTWSGRQGTDSPVHSSIRSCAKILQLHWHICQDRSIGWSWMLISTASGLVWSSLDYLEHLLAWWLESEVQARIIMSVGKVWSWLGVNMGPWYG